MSDLQGVSEVLPPPKKARKFTGLIVVFWSIVVIPVLGVEILIYLISTGNMGFMPSFAELENPQSKLASELISSDQVSLGKFYIENRTFVSFEDLSPHLVNALIATEDARYYEHSGIDTKAFGRVAYGVASGERKGGGSTITQQLAKNLFPRDTIPNITLWSKISNLGITKIKEWVTAIRLERNYTKEEIMVMYLNVVPYGSQSYGIKSAARTFFNTTPDSLKAEQAAVLIGLLKAPTYYSPVRNPERATQRRNVVLAQMYKYGYLDRYQYDSIIKIPLELSFQIRDHNVGTAMYFREYIRQTMTAKADDDSVRWATDPLYGWCHKNLKADGTPYNLYLDGLKIYTTINSKMQLYAENAVTKHMGGYLHGKFMKEQEKSDKAPFNRRTPYKVIETLLKRSVKNSERYRKLRKAGYSADSIVSAFNNPTEMRVFTWHGEVDTVMTPFDSIRYYKHFLNCGFISIEPHTGYVRAYVGGINYKHFKYDHVTQAKRQVGSTFKPFLYTLAMETGYAPCDMVPNVPVSFRKWNGEYWTPKNAGLTKSDGKMVSLKWGLTNSVNNISAWLMKRFSPNAVISIARRMGVKSYIINDPTICLGVCDLNVYELVGAYGPFANHGIFSEPIVVTRIEDKNGNIISSFVSESQEAISEEAAYLMLDILKNVVRAGTSTPLTRKPYNFTHEVAGKTGTTDDGSDGWFIGITPHLVSGAWVGGEDRTIRFRNQNIGQGAGLALPIFGYYMKSVYEDSTLTYSTEDIFDPPAKGLSVSLDCLGQKLMEKKLVDIKDSIMNELDL